MKQAVWGGATIGSILGEFVPSLWGADMFSFSSVIFTALGGILGIYIAFKLSQ